MKLANFIREAEDEIVAHAVTFAKSLPPLASARVDLAALRDHLPQILRAISKDLEAGQTRSESIAKSEGRGPKLALETAAETHGRMRAESGLSIGQLVSEYRVLRSVVTRLWLENALEQGAAAFDDLIRFNEAIDQVLAESVTFHTSAVERWRDTLLGVVAHDLRNPLSALMVATELLSLKNPDGPMRPTVDLISRSAIRLSALIESLLDYCQIRLGSNMSLARAHVDLGAVCREEVDLLRAAFPEASIEFSTSGAVEGEFDANRIREAMANLVSNAVQYHEPGTPIAVAVVGTAKHVAVSVVNHGEAIEQKVLDTLFEPLRRREENGAGSGRNLGLGLFIVKEIVTAHGGIVSAEARGGSVVFAMKLPKSVA